MPRTKHTTALIAAASLALAACGGGGGTVIEVSAIEAWRVAENTVLAAYEATDDPDVNDLREAFDEVTSSVELSEYWHLLEKSESQMEVQLWEPKPDDVIKQTGATSEHRLVESEETTTTTAGGEEEDKSDTSTSGEAPVTTAESKEAKDATETTTEEKDSETSTTEDHSSHTTEKETKVLLYACISKHDGEWESSNGACEKNEEHSNDDSHGHESAKSDTHWSYAGDTGPEKWGSMNEAWLACEMGTAQSPIELSGAVGADLPNPVFSYKKSEAMVEDNGHTIVFKNDSPNTVKIDDTTWNLQQMHYHTPGEHTVEGKRSAAEVHLVHQDDGGHYLVVSLMLEGGADKDSWGFVKGEATTTVDWASLLPDNLTSVRYKGSLTTPPCSEGVKWVLMTTPVRVTDATIKELEAHHNGNNRPVQDTGDRLVERDLTTDK